MVEELRGLKLMVLSKRALSMGVDSELVEEAMEADDGKSAVIALIVEIESRRGPVDRMKSLLESGCEGCAEALGSVLDNAMEVLEQLSTSSPRKARRTLRDMCDRVETWLDCVDAEWCDGVSRCADGELDRLSGVMVCVRGLSSSSNASEASSAVTSMVECLDRCGSVVVQSVGVLSGAGAGTDDGYGSAGVMCALESLRGLSEARMESVCADEAAAFEVVQHRLSGLDACGGDEVVSGCMALFTLSCRHGWHWWILLR